MKLLEYMLYSIAGAAAALVATLLTIAIIMVIQQAAVGREIDRAKKGED